MSKAFINIEATYRISTPMFCAGGDQGKAELRVPSIKGALRFWWRSLKWATIQEPRELRDEEARIFGASDQQVGRSRVQLRLKHQELAQSTDESNLFRGSLHDGTRYFSYGVVHPIRGTLERPMIETGTFTLALRCGPGLPDTAVDELTTCLIVLGTVGGLGSKSRKGLGSVSLTKLAIEGREVILPDDPVERLRGCLNMELSKKLPDWTAWSMFQKLVVLRPRETDAMRVLALLTKHLKEHIKDGNNSIVFGLPRQGASSPQVERRASPVFLHVHQTEERCPAIGMALVLPCRFLPNDTMFTPDFWDPVAGYLKRLRTNGAEEVSLV